MRPIQVENVACPDCKWPHQFVGETLFGSYAFCCKAAIERHEDRMRRSPAGVVYVAPLPFAGDLFDGVRS